MKNKIMVSSTISDLPSEREAAYRAIRSLGSMYEPLMSEKTFGALNQPSKEACIETVEKCDYYILIIGNRYGHIYDDESNESVTKLEWKTAKDNDKPMLVFVSNGEIEPLQQEFLNLVGDFHKGRHFETFSNAFELAEKIESGLKKIIRDEEKEVISGKEKVTLNLVKIKCPDDVFVMPLNVESKKRAKESERGYVWRMLKRQGLESTSEWMIKNDQIYSFHDLTNEDNPLSKIGYSAYTEKHKLNQLSKNDKTQRYVTELLASSLRHYLYECDPSVHWYYDKKYKHKNCFYFAASDELKPIEIKWGASNMPREVFGERIQTNYRNKKDYKYYRHLSFKPDILMIKDHWYLAFSPTWLFTFDGERLDRFHSDKISSMKRLENNNAVRNHTNFWIWFLCNRSMNLFGKQDFRAFLEFEEIPAKEIEYSIDDQVWVKHEAELKKKNLSQTNLF